MAKRFILSVVLALCILFIYPNMVYAETKNTSEFSISVTYKQTEARSMLDSINAFRQDGNMAWYWNENNSKKIYCSNLKTLVYDYDLEKAAMQRAAELVVKFDHQRPNGTYFSELIDGYSSGGENIACGQRTSEEVFVDWREDDDNYAGQGHRRNMLDGDFNRVGIACAEYRGVRFWVQIFGTTSKQAANGTTANNSSTQVTIQVLESDISDRGFNFNTDTIMLMLNVHMQSLIPIKH